MDELQILGFGINSILIFSLVINFLLLIGFILIVYALLGINFKLGDIRDKVCK